MNRFSVNVTSTFDDLFLERLDAFTEKNLADIKAFSLRENISYDQVRFPHFPHALPKFMFFRFAVTSQKDTLSIFSVVQSLWRPVGRAVRLGVPTTSART